MELITRTTPAEAGPRNRGPMPAKRQCAEPGCTTPLCSYNRTDSCSLHGGWTQPIARSRMPGDDLAEIMEMAA